MDFFRNLPNRSKIIIAITAGVAIIILAFILFNGNQSESEEWESSSSELPVEESSSEVSETDTDTSKAASAVLMADVKGAVVNPGVYEFEEGDRVGDLIEKAGGLTPDADPNQINMAEVAYDAMVIYVPTKGEASQVGEQPNTGETASGSSGTQGASTEGKVNINTATEEELMTLPGIGASKAAAIISTREEKGGFKSIEEIKDVEGIGDQTYEDIKDLICV